MMRTCSGQIRRRLQRAVEARGTFGVFVQQLFNFAHTPIHGHDFVGIAEVVLFAELFQFFREAGDVADVFAEAEIQRHEASVKLFADGLAQLGVQFADLLLDEAFQFAVVEGFQRGGVHAHVAEHEFGAQRPTSKSGTLRRRDRNRACPMSASTRPTRVFVWGRASTSISPPTSCQREQAAVHAPTGAVDGDVQTVQSLKGRGDSGCR